MNVTDIDILFAVFVTMCLVVLLGPFVIAFFKQREQPDSAIDFIEAPMVSIIHTARDGKTYYILGNKALDRYAAFEMCDWATLEKWFAEDEKETQ